MSSHHGHTARLRDWDYSRPAAYFVTFSVEDRRPVLSSLAHDAHFLLPAGRIVAECWHQLSGAFSGLALDAFVVMPEHVHGIIVLRASPRDENRSQGWQPLMSDPGPSLGKIVRHWKGATTFRIRREVDPDFRWQTRYYEHVIRGRSGLERIRRYIEENPKRRLGG